MLWQGTPFLRYFSDSSVSTWEHGFQTDHSLFIQKHAVKHFSSGKAMSRAFCNKIFLRKECNFLLHRQPELPVQQTLGIERKYTQKLDVI